MSDQLKSVRHPSVLFQAIDLQLILLSCQDSNLDKQDQNLLCYHYTTRQFRTAKIVNFPKTKKYRLKIYLFRLQNHHFFAVMSQ